MSQGEITFDKRVDGSIFLLVGGASLLAQNGGVLYWVVPALLIAMVAAIISAWVVLVEAAR